MDSGFLRLRDLPFRKRRFKQRNAASRTGNFPGVPVNPWVDGTRSMASAIRRTGVVVEPAREYREIREMERSL